MSVMLCFRWFFSKVVHCLQRRGLFQELYPARFMKNEMFHLILLISLLNPISRYPSDRYDRVWTSYSSYFRNAWIQIFTTLQVEVNNLENYYDPPNAALTSAATPTNSNLPLMINWTSSNVDNQYYFYTHFAEIQELQTNDTREFSIVWNGEVLRRQFIPPKFSAFSLYRSSPSTCEGGKCSLQLIRTNTSTLPPLINALEVYTVIHFSQSETNENDGMLGL